MNNAHKKLAKGKWHTMPLVEQLGNIGSEYERALLWKKKNNTAYFEKASDRMLELLDMTIADPRWKNHRLKELTRLREVICEELFGNTVKTKQTLTPYFLSFATKARASYNVKRC